MRPDIAVKDDAGRIVVDERTLAVLALRMARVGQPLGSAIVREGAVVTGAAPPFGDGLPVEARARRRHILVERTPDGAMGDNDIVPPDGRQRVGLPPDARSGQRPEGTVSVNPGSSQGSPGKQ